MGLYPIECSVCEKVFMWFSGNLDQRCQNCQKNNVTEEIKREDKRMTKKELEVKVLDLEKKIVVLEARPICYGFHQCSCGCHHGNWPNTINPFQPNTYPWYGTTTISGINSPSNGSVDLNKIS